MQNNKKKEVKSFGTMCTDLYLWVILGIFPLHISNHYFDITSAKSKFFLWTSGIYLVMVLLGAMIEGKFSRSELEKLRFSVADLGAAAFAVINVISYCISINRKESLFGANSRYMGFVMMLMLVGVYFAVSRNYEYRESVFAIFAFSSCVTYLIAIAQFFKWNVFHLQVQNTIFMSTFGNINVCAVFFACTSVCFLLTACMKEEHIMQAYYGIIGCLGLFAIVAARSDSAYITLVVFAVVLFYFVIWGKISLKRVAVLLTGVECTIILIRILTRCLPNNLGIRDYGLLFTSNRMIAVNAIVIAFCLVLGQIKGKKSICIRPKTLKIIVGSLLWIGIIAVCIFFILLVTPFADKISPKAFSGRFYMWVGTVRYMKAQNIGRILFGNGQEVTRNVFVKLGEIDPARAQYYGSRISSVHCDWLQILLTNGILGVIAYLTMIFNHIYRGLTEEIEGSKKACIYGAVMFCLAYMMQSLVNITQPVSSPYLFVMLAVCAGVNQRKLSASRLTHKKHKRGEKR